MARLVAALVVAVGWVGLGWSVGRAQSAAPDFEIVIHGALGDTDVKCLKGCKLAYREKSGPVDSAKAKEEVAFDCAQQRCEVFASGWVQR